MAFEGSRAACCKKVAHQNENNFTVDPHLAVGFDSRIVIGIMTRVTPYHQVRENRVARSAGHRSCTVGIQHIADALIASGYTSLDQQAKALGINRSTAWTIVKVKHKLGRLSARTTERMLANPELPGRVRAVIQQYLTERCAPSERASTSQGRSQRRGAKRG